MRILTAAALSLALLTAPTAAAMDRLAFWNCSFPNRPPVTLVYGYEEDAGVMISEFGAVDAEVGFGPKRMMSSVIKSNGEVQSLTNYTGDDPKATFWGQTLKDGKLVSFYAVGTCERGN
jgi:hypothetical protein